MRIEKLLQEMTIAEKAGQMHQLSPSIVGGFDVSFEELIEMMTDGRISAEEFQRIMAGAKRDFHEGDIRAGKIGSFLLDDPVKANELQKIAVEESRLGIPLIFGFDVIHGFQTVFPIPLAETCAWDEELWQESAAIAAKEARAHNIHWAFAPMVDISRDARWGRISESPGEDPYLASVYAKGKVKGFQETNQAKDECLAACLKHYIAYGAAEAGRDYNTVSMAENMLRNGYLPPFQAGVDAGAMTVMAAFNDYNGIPCTVNRHLLRDILKGEMNFEGFVVSDATGMKECITHGIGEDLADISKQAVTAGLDMDMNSFAYHEHLVRQVESGEIPMEVLDDAVRRILRVKETLGLFDNPYVTAEKMQQYDELPAKHVAKALEAARKSIVLLKNDDVLPLRHSQKIALIGALAAQPTETLGAWAMCGREKDCVSIYQGLKQRGADVTYQRCCGAEGEFVASELSEAVKGADVIVAVVGETAAMSGEAASRADITLPGAQREMLAAAVATGKPVIAILMNGRPLALSWEHEHLHAIVEGWQLGIQMGTAIADVLFGAYNPTGKLCCTFPAENGQCPMYYNHPNTGRPGSKSKFTSRYLDAPVAPLYPFGYGLSYTSFAYDDLTVTEQQDHLKISVMLENTGPCRGEETVQLYMGDITASLVRPVKELKAFVKATLAPGERKQINFDVSKTQMGFYDDAGIYRMEDGTFLIGVGGNSRDCLTEKINVSFGGR